MLDCIFIIGLFIFFSFFYYFRFLVIKEREENEQADDEYAVKHAKDDSEDEDYIPGSNNSTLNQTNKNSQT
jgi:phosphotransferase system  glucose/maltose/N-acetylglucosamine-specific IIC component